MFSKRRITMGGDVFRDEYSLAFDGTDDYIVVSDHASLSFDAFSSVGWIKLEDATDCPIITKGTYNSTAEYAIKLQSDDKLHFWVADESVSSCHIGRESPALTSYEGQWIHFACTYDGGTASSGLKIYINGSQVDNGNDEGNAGSFVAMEDLAANVHISRYGSVYGELSISDLAIYGTELTQGEVLSLYNGREPYNHMEGSIARNLTAWWRMGDGSLDRQAIEGGIVTDMKQTTYIDTTDLVTNGTFTGNATGWTLGTGWAYDSNNATCSSDNNNLSQDVSAVADTVYRVEIDISTYTSGLLVADIGGSTSVSIPQATGSYVGYILAENTNDLRFYGGAFRGTVDNIRVFKVFGNPGVTYNMAVNDFEGDTP